MLLFKHLHLILSCLVGTLLEQIEDYKILSYFDKGRYLNKNHLNYFFSLRNTEKKNNKELPGIFVTTPGVQKFYDFILIWPIIKTKLCLWEIILL